MSSNAPPTYTSVLAACPREWPPQPCHARSIKSQSLPFPSAAADLQFLPPRNHQCGASRTISTLGAGFGCGNTSSYMATYPLSATHSPEARQLEWLTVRTNQQSTPPVAAQVGLFIAATPNKFWSRAICGMSSACQLLPRGDLGTSGNSPFQFGDKGALLPPVKAIRQALL
jgi:hypothetical protein